VDVPIDTCPPDVVRTPAMAPLVSSQRPHDVHGDAPDAVDASTLTILALSRQKSARSELTVASSLRRARAHSSLRLSPPNFTQSSAVSRSSLSTLYLAVLPPTRVAVTFFSGELNAEPCKAARRLWLDPRGCLGS